MCMNTITISKTEYKKLKRYSSAYLKIVEEITEAEREFPYDTVLVGNLTKQARVDHKKGYSIEAKSVDDALTKFHQR